MRSGGTPTRRSAAEFSGLIDVNPLTTRAMRRVRKRPRRVLVLPSIGVCPWMVAKTLRRNTVPATSPTSKGYRCSARGGPAGPHPPTQQRQGLEGEGQGVELADPGTAKAIDGMAVDLLEGGEIARVAARHDRDVVPTLPERGHQRLGRHLGAPDDRVEAGDDVAEVQPSGSRTVGRRWLSPVRSGAIIRGRGHQQAGRVRWSRVGVVQPLRWRASGSPRLAGRDHGCGMEPP